PLAALPEVRQVERIEARRYRIRGGPDVEPAVARASAGWTVRTLGRHRASLEDVFLALVGEERQPRRLQPRSRTSAVVAVESGRAGVDAGLWVGCSIPFSGDQQKDTALVEQRPGKAASTAALCVSSASTAVARRTAASSIDGSNPPQRSVRTSSWGW